MKHLKYFAFTAALCSGLSAAPAPQAFANSNVQVNQSMLKAIQSGQLGRLKPYKPAAPVQTASAQPSAPAQDLTSDPGFIPLAPQDTQNTLTKKVRLSQPEDITVKPIGITPPPFSMWEATWSGRANLGASLQKGDGENKNIDFDATATALWDNNDRIIMSLDIGYEKDNKTETVDDKTLEIAFNDYINKKTYLDYDTRFEKDDVSGVDIRATMGLGLGYQAFNHDLLKVRMSGGVAFMIEEMKTDGDKENEKSAAYNWKFDFERKLKNEAAVLYHKHRLLVPAENNNDYVLDTNTGVRVPLRNRLIASLDVEHDIDEGVVDGRSESDTRYSVKLGYEW